MKLPPPPPLDPPPPERVPEGRPDPEASTTDDTHWYDIDFSHHVNYLDRWSHGAVTEGSLTRAPFGYLSKGKHFVSDQTDSNWTDAEKLGFFGSLARRSRWQPDMIAQEIGSKSQAEVVRYIEALERERRILKVFHKPRKTHLRGQGWISGLAPAAREIKPARIEWEEKCAEIINAREFQKCQESEISLARQEQSRKLEAVSAAHRKEAHEMEKSLNEDYAAMRPRRLSILKRAKVALDTATETAKSEYAARVIKDVLKTCDGNGLKVMDALVRQTAKRTKDPKPPEATRQATPGATRQATPETTRQATPESSTNVAAPPILPPPPGSNCAPLPKLSGRSRITAEREQQEKERYAYLSRFPVRRLDARHKAEKQMLAKRIRRREVRKEKRLGGQTAGADAPGPGSAQNGDPEAGGERVDADGTTVPGPSSINNSDHAAESGNSGAADGLTSAHTDTTSVQAEPTPSATSPVASRSRITVFDPVKPAVLPLELTSYRTHRPDTLEKHAAKIETEQYEKARSEYLSRIPRIELTDEQKREKRTLTQRVRSREQYRLKAAAKAGLKVEEQAMEMVDAPTADIRLFLLNERKRKRQSDSGSTAKDDKQTKKQKRYEEEQEEYDRLMVMNAENPLSTEDRARMDKLGSRIRSREWRRIQAANVIRVGLKQWDIVNEGPGNTAGREDNIVHDAGANPESATSGEPDPQASKIDAVQDPVGGTTEPLNQKKENVNPIPEPTAEPLKKKRGRPAKKLAVVQASNQVPTVVPVPSSLLEQRSRRTNQYDESGIGKTRFAQELKTYHDIKVAEFLSFCDHCERDFEDDFRLFLRANVKAVEKLLSESRYAPQLYSFFESRRLDLLNLPGIAKMLSHASHVSEDGEGRTVDLAHLLDSLVSMETLLRRTIEFCTEMSTDRQPSDSTTATVDQDTILHSLSLLGQPSTNTSGQQEKGDTSRSASEEPVPPRLPDAEWVGIVAPSDGLWEGDPIAEADADAEVEELRQLEVERQQSILDRLEDKELEDRLAMAIVHPEAVAMETTALPALENDVFDWNIYEVGKSGQWRTTLRKLLHQRLPKTWVQGIPDDYPATALAAKGKRVKDIEVLRQTLKSTLYSHNRLRWQRIKRIRDPMYRLGNVPRLYTSYKSAAYIDTTDDGGSDTDTETEKDQFGEEEHLENVDQLEEEERPEDGDELEKEDQVVEEDGKEDESMEEDGKEDELMEEDGKEAELMGEDEPVGEEA